MLRFINPDRKAITNSSILRISRKVSETADIHPCMRVGTWSHVLLIRIHVFTYINIQAQRHVFRHTFPPSCFLYIYVESYGRTHDIYKVLLCPSALWTEFIDFYLFSLQPKRRQTTYVAFGSWYLDSFMLHRDAWVMFFSKLSSFFIDEISVMDIRLIHSVYQLCTMNFLDIHILAINNIIQFSRFNFWT